MADTFQNFDRDLLASYTKAVPVVVGTALDPYPRALYFGTGGTATVTMMNGGSATFKQIPNGSVLPVRVKSVDSVSGAADILGLL